MSSPLDAGPAAQPGGDGLSWPVSFGARYGAGKDRAVVLGGGGVFLVAWYAGYLTGLLAHGVDLGRADLIVGTSAGSWAGALLAAGALHGGDGPSQWVPRVQPMGGLTEATSYPSQQRAEDLLATAPDAGPATIQEIGRAALACHGPDPGEARRVLRSILRLDGWPSDAFHACAVDAFTAERLVLTHATGISVTHAAACSCAVPGKFRPQPLRDRFCLDGVVSGSNTHCDLVAGAGRALVLALEANDKVNSASVPFMTLAPGYLGTECAQLAQTGTRSLVKGPESYDPAQLTSAAAAPGGWVMGARQASADAAEVGQFWAG
jgi:NTE family protein